MCLKWLLILILGGAGRGGKEKKEQRRTKEKGLWLVCWLLDSLAFHPTVLKHNSNNNLFSFLS